jgi:peptidyl-prolyl cis-trans isomerase D
LIILVIAFAAWGIGDVLRTGGGGPDDVATIGDDSISGQRLLSEFRNDLARLQQRNPGLTAEEARRQGLHIQTLLRLIGQSLVQAEANALGVAISDELVRRSVLEEPAFRDDAGKFDRDAYEKRLRNARLTPDRYEEIVRTDLRREQVLGAVAAERPTPRAFAEAVYRIRRETRSAEAAIVPRDDTLEVAEPDEATIEAFHKDHPGPFTAPEIRTVSLLRLAPDMLAATIELSDDDLKAEYDSRVAEFKLPETRTIEQVLAKDEALIKEGRKLLDDGQSFEAVAQALTAKGATVNVLNNVTKEALPSELAGIVFGLERDTPSQPVQTAFGWTLFRVKEIAAPRTRSFEETKDEIKNEMSLRLAADSQVRLSKTIEDELAGGANIEQAAKAVGVDLQQLSFDAAGFDKGAVEVLAGAADREDIIKASFALDVGADSGLKETEAQTIFLVRLDSVEEAKLRPLADVRDKVITALKISDRVKRAEAAAQALADKIKAGAKLSDAATEAGYEVVTWEALSRDQPSEARGTTPALQRQLFEQDPAAPSPIVGAIPEGYVVALLTRRALPDPAEADTEIESIAASLGRSRSADLSIAYQGALERRIGVAVDQKRLNDLFASQQDQQ